MLHQCREHRTGISRKIPLRANETCRGVRFVDGHTCIFTLYAFLPFILACITLHFFTLCVLSMSPNHRALSALYRYYTTKRGKLEKVLFTLACDPFGHPSRARSNDSRRNKHLPIHSTAPWTRLLLLPAGGGCSRRSSCTAFTLL